MDHRGKDGEDHDITSNFNQKQGGGRDFLVQLFGKGGAWGRRMSGGGHMQGKLSMKQRSYKVKAQTSQNGGQEHRQIKKVFP